MGWFDEQIKQKIKQDEDLFCDALQNMAGIVMGKKRIREYYEDERIAAIEAMEQILKFYHVKAREIPDNLKDMESILEYLMRPSGFMRRKVRLNGAWYKDGIGAMLGTYRKSKKAVAILPDGSGGYVFREEKSGKKVRVNEKNAGMLENEALCFYKPLPLKKVCAKELFLYAFQSLSSSDIVAVFLAALAVTLMGIFPVCANRLIFDQGIAADGMNVLVSCALLLIGSGISAILFRMIREILLAKMKTKISISVESAAMMRVLSLPTEFFRRYSSGELAQRMQDLGGVCGMAMETILMAGTALITFVVGILQIQIYTPLLTGSVLFILFCLILLFLIQIFVKIRLEREKMTYSAKESGLVYSLFLGIAKIRMSGSEQRAFGKWARQYKEYAELEYNPPFFIKSENVLRMTILLGGNLLIYEQAIRNGIAMPDYISFHVAYATIMGACTAFTSASGAFAEICAVFDMIRPVLEEIPEISQNRQVVTRLSGGIELTNISFRYQKSMPMLFENLSLKIRPGQYVAIVGKTGCGKSTLMRILLGFEKPEKGAVYYDGKDLNSLDLKSLRKYMGVVMQNGKIFPGSIYSNIVISAPQLTVEDAWRAAEMAGLAEDIRQMPMGMHTLIAESGSGFSGGQKQRLMIARAVAAKPKILFFDEATSALDNITQKIVAKSLDALKCTRIVIAHRLSTIQQCDRIVVLDEGKIIEDGTYEELIAKNGFFTELVERQRVRE